MKKRHLQKLTIISLVALVFMVTPIMAIYNKAGVTIWGVPLLYFVLFVILFLVVFASWLVIKLFDV